MRPAADHRHAGLVKFFITLTRYSGLHRIIVMRYLSHQITFQEIPDEISLSFLITGCPLKCKGCHSTDSWLPAGGLVLTVEIMAGFILKYRHAITCVLFLGGEWESENLISLLIFCKKQKLKTALYTGLESVNSAIANELTFLKTGRWIKELGGLAAPNTNQKLINLKTGKILNSYFTAQGGQHGEINGRTGQQETRFHKALSEKS